jgi:hypothetical protein
VVPPIDLHHKDFIHSSMLAASRGNRTQWAKSLPL